MSFKIFSMKEKSERDKKEEGKEEKESIAQEAQSDHLRNQTVLEFLDEEVNREKIGGSPLDFRMNAASSKKKVRHRDAQCYACARHLLQVRSVTAPKSNVVTLGQLCKDKGILPFRRRGIEAS